jgi:hypothetical protein
MNIRPLSICLEQLVRGGYVVGRKRDVSYPITSCSIGIRMSMELEHR